MLVELIPVIELLYYHEDLASPVNGPFWEYPSEWEEYNQASLTKYGFTIPIQSYSKGSFLYPISEIEINNLTKLVMDEIQDMRAENEREYAGSFSGGYILKIEGQEKLYPQCCGSLKDIESWESIFEDPDNVDFWIGHPSPSIIVNENSVTFDLIHSNVSENYVPRTEKTIFEVDKLKLKEAIGNIKIMLGDFSKKLIEVNEREQLNIVDIDKLLIYGV